MWPPDLKNEINSDYKIVEMYLKLQESQTIAMMVIIALQLARLLAVKLVENELAKRANEKTQWPPCPECGGLRIRKGHRSRELNTRVVQSNGFVVAVVVPINVVLVKWLL